MAEDFQSFKYSRGTGYESIRGGIMAEPVHNTYVYGNFSLDEELPLGRAVIRVLDAETDEVIREIPTEQVLAIAHRISEQLAEADNSQIDGLIISAQA